MREQNMDVVALLGLISSLITIGLAIYQGIQVANKRKLPEKVFGGDEYSHYYFRILVIEALYTAGTFIFYITKNISPSVAATMFVFGIIVTVAMMIFPNALKQYNNARHSQNNEEDLTPPQDN
jgi:phosphoglycerol transferase MdoB-like AlkP superfamily enzyme